MRVHTEEPQRRREATKRFETSSVSFLVKFIAICPERPQKSEGVIYIARRASGCCEIFWKSHTLQRTRCFEPQSDVM